MRKVSKRQRDDCIAIMESIKAYAQKYGEDYMSFSYCCGNVSANNEPNIEHEHYDLVLFKDGKLIHNLCDQYIIIREGA